MCAGVYMCVDVYIYICVPPLVNQQGPIFV